MARHYQSEGGVSRGNSRPRQGQYSPGNVRLFPGRSRAGFCGAARKMWNAGRGTGHLGCGARGEWMSRDTPRPSAKTIQITLDQQLPASYRNRPHQCKKKANVSANIHPPFPAISLVNMPLLAILHPASKQRVPCSSRGGRAILPKRKCVLASFYQAKTHFLLL